MYTYDDHADLTIKEVTQFLGVVPDVQTPFSHNIEMI
jgi:hypothetical protein